MSKFKGLVRILSAKSPQILTGLSVVGLYATAFLSSKATLKANDILNENREELKDLDKIEKTKFIVKNTWQCYIPAITSSLITTFCIIKSGRIYSHRHAAALALYSLTDTALREYQTKVRETFGDSKEGKIRDSIARDHILRKPAESKEIIMTGSGNVLCYDTPSGRYFKSDIEKVRRTENTFNQTLRSEMQLSLNDLYYELGLEPTRLGDNAGWDIEKHILTFRYSSQLTETNTPCLVIDYDIYPIHGK